MLMFSFSDSSNSNSKGMSKASFDKLSLIDISQKLAILIKTSLFEFTMVSLAFSGKAPVKIEPLR